MSFATAAHITASAPGPLASPLTGPLTDSLTMGELRAWRGLLRAHACLSKRLDQALDQAHRLPMSSYEVLHHLHEASGERMRMCDLAEHAQLSRSGLTRLVDRLEREGLLARCSCDHDARGAYACLTDAGRQKLEEARVTQMAVIREHFFSRFSGAELELLADMWERLAPPCIGNGHAGNGC